MQEQDIKTRAPDLKTVTAVEVKDLTALFRSGGQDRVIISQMFVKPRTACPHIGSVRQIDFCYMHVSYKLCRVSGVVIMIMRYIQDKLIYFLFF